MSITHKAQKTGSARERGASGNATVFAETLIETDPCRTSGGAGAIGMDRRGRGRLVVLVTVSQCFVRFSITQISPWPLGTSRLLKGFECFESLSMNGKSSVRLKSLHSSLRTAAPRPGSATTRDFLYDRLSAMQVRVVDGRLRSRADEPLAVRRQRVAYGVLFRWHVRSPVMRCQEAAVRRSG